MNTPQYFYETEIEWTGDKDVKLSGGKLPAIAAGAPPEFKGREGNWSPEHLFVASHEQLLRAYSSRDCGIIESVDREFVVDCPREIGKSSRRRLSNHGNRREATRRSRFGQRSRAHAAHLGKSQRELFHLQFD